MSGLWFCGLMVAKRGTDPPPHSQLHSWWRMAEEWAVIGDCNEEAVNNGL